MKVLVGFTTSPEGRAALRNAVAEAQRRDAELVVVHYERVAPPVGEVTGRFREAEEFLQQLKADIEVQGVEVSVHSTIGVSSAAAELLRTAEAEDAELIVIGLRRRTPVGKLVLGSTAQEILLNAACPVLAVKRDDET